MKRAWIVLLSLVLVSSPASAAVGDIDRYAGGGGGDDGQATGAVIFGPTDITVAPGGDLLIAESQRHRIRRVHADGTIDRVAGDGVAGFDGDGGPATIAHMRYPQGVVVRADGRIVIADTGNHRLREVALDGTIDTIAGTGSQGFAGDGGPAVAARLASPTALTIDPTTGDILFSDSVNRRLRRIATDGTISTVAGNGFLEWNGDGGPATAAGIGTPNGVVVDSVGRIDIASTDGHAVRQVALDGTITTIVGDGTPGDAGDGGPATAARLNWPRGLSIDSTGRLLIADSVNSKIRAVAPGGTISTVAGNGMGEFAGDGGQATAASLFFPGKALVRAGEILIADQQNNRVRSVNTTTGVISTLAGSGDCCFAGEGQPAAAADLNHPTGTTFRPNGAMIIVDTLNHRIREVGTDGIIRTIAGTGERAFGGDGGNAMNAKFVAPRTAAVNASGTMVVTDTGNYRVRRIAPDGTISTIAGTGVPGISRDGGSATSARLASIRGVALSSGGTVYFTEGSNSRRIRRVKGGIIATVAGGGASFAEGVRARTARFDSPVAVAIDSDGSFLVADRGRNRIRRVRNGIVRTFAWISQPMSVAIAPDGYLIVVSINGRVWRISPTGVRTVIAGNGVIAYGAYDGDGGPALAATLGTPTWASVSPTGDVYVTDVVNDRIRWIDR